MTLSSAAIASIISVAEGDLRSAMQTLQLLYSSASGGAASLADRMPQPQALSKKVGHRRCATIDTRLHCYRIDSSCLGERELQWGVTTFTYDIPVEVLSVVTLLTPSQRAQSPPRRGPLPLLRKRPLPSRSSDGSWWGSRRRSGTRACSSSTPSGRSCTTSGTEDPLRRVTERRLPPPPVGSTTMTAVSMKSRAPEGGGPPLPAAPR